MTETRKDPAPAPFRDASECLEAWFAALGPAGGWAGTSGHPSLLCPISGRLPALRLPPDALADDRWLALLPELLARPRSGATPARGAEEVAAALSELLGAS